LYYTTRFVDGLKDDIRSTVLVQRPYSFDTTCTLALLQEEVGDPYRRKDAKHVESSHSSRPPPQTSLPLPAPPYIDKPASSTLAPVEPPPYRDSRKFQGDKFASIRAYRIARGLCDRCAKKWHPGRKCSTTVQLNALQEVFDLFADQAAQEVPYLSTSDTDFQQQDLLFMALSKDVVSGIEGPQTMRLQGSIQNHSMATLVNSGSSHTFISKRLANQLSGAMPLP
jgi:hypothetical protein